MSTPEPLVYSAGSKAVLLRTVPAHLLREHGVETTCSRCSVPVVAMRVTLEEMLACALESGRALVFVCQDCLPDVLAGKEDVVFATITCPEVAALLQRDQAERN